MFLPCKRTIPLSHKCTLFLSWTYAISLANVPYFYLADELFLSHEHAMFLSFANMFWLLLHDLNNTQHQEQKWWVLLNQSLHQSAPASGSTRDHDTDHGDSNLNNLHGFRWVLSVWTCWQFDFIQCFSLPGAHSFLAHLYTSQPQLLDLLGVMTLIMHGGSNRNDPVSVVLSVWTCWHTDFYCFFSLSGAHSFLFYPYTSQPHAASGFTRDHDAVHGGSNHNDPVLVVLSYSYLLP